MLQQILDESEGLIVCSLHVFTMEENSKSIPFSGIGRRQSVNDDVIADNGSAISEHVATSEN